MFLEILTANTMITIKKLREGVGLDHEGRSLMNASVPSLKIPQRLPMSFLPLEEHTKPTSFMHLGVDLYHTINLLATSSWSCWLLRNAFLLVVFYLNLQCAATPEL